MRKKISVYVITCDACGCEIDTAKTALNGDTRAFVILSYLDPAERTGRAYKDFCGWDCAHRYTHEKRAVECIESGKRAMLNSSIN